MDLEQIRAYRNDRSAFSRKMGIVTTEIRAGYARAVKTIGDDDTNPVDRCHGAVLFALADIVCGSAAVSHGTEAVTMNASYNFLRACKAGDTITAEAHEVKHGSTISVYNATLTDQDGHLVGSATTHFYNLKSPLNIPPDE